MQHYHISIEKVDYAQKTIFGKTGIAFNLQQAADSLSLDLLGMSIDTIYGQNFKRYAYDGRYLKIYFSQAILSGNIQIQYHGKPQQDATWGGFYFSGVYAFNLGVGFTSEPHNLGRVWFPCNDNFSDRATYTFAIQVPENYKAMCNGILDSTAGNIWYWNMKVPIPTYLASMAVAPYEIVQWEHKGIPFTLASLPADTAKMRGSFKQLNLAFDVFESSYGPHFFPRVGYNAVPFSSGAMEHASNIAYPLNTITGFEENKTLYAHELAHHWFGNAVTCADASQMWLNEGWATYSEHLFVEKADGIEAYRQEVSNVHKSILHYAHLKDEGYYPVNGVDHDRTYGMHVYQKGADMIHTLRGYMGDSAFFKACQSYMTKFKGKNATTDDLKSEFQKFTTRNLDLFFKYWINAPGFTAFNIFSWSAQPVGDGTYNLNIRIKQNLRNAPELFREVPMEIYVFDDRREFEVHELILSGLDSLYSLKVDRQPTFLALDFAEKISDAITDDKFISADTLSQILPSALFSCDILKNPDSTLLRVEHFWTSPDHYYLKKSNFLLSSRRYWKVDGIWNQDFKARGYFEFNARKPGSSYNNGYLDDDLDVLNEDSIVLMYRMNPESEWELAPGVKKLTGTNLDKKATYTVEPLLKGEYAFAKTGVPVGIPSLESNLGLVVYPNPSDHWVYVRFDSEREPYLLEITDLQGRISHQARLNQGESEYIYKEKLVPGVYWVSVYTPIGLSQSTKLIVK